MPRHDGDAKTLRPRQEWAPTTPSERLRTRALMIAGEGFGERATLPWILVETHLPPAVQQDDVVPALKQYLMSWLINDARRLVLRCGSAVRSHQEGCAHRVSPESPARRRGEARGSRTISPREARPRLPMPPELVLASS